MLVLSRHAGESITITSADESCVATVLKISADAGKASILVTRASVDRPGQLEPKTIELDLNAGVRTSPTVELWLIDVQGEKMRLGINAPRQSAIHRLEVFEAINQQNWDRGGEGDPDRGAAGSPVPRPSGPTPPSLDVRLDEPHTYDDAGD